MKQEKSSVIFQAIKFILILNTFLAVLIIAAGIFGGINFKWFGSDTFNLGIIPLSVCLIYGLAASILVYFQYKSGIEEEDRELLEKQKERKRTFNSEEDILFTADRTLNTFKKVAPYVISGLCSIGISFGLYLYLKNWNEIGFPLIPEEPVRATFVAAIYAFFSFFLGVFYVGQSRVKNFRWFRPLGVWLILFAGLMLASIIAILFKESKVPQWDYYLSRGFLCIFGILSVELLINFIIEFYRPRIGIEERPVFESRLLSIITEPGGILRNLADTLDYQFGFQVSGTWIYRFLEKSISPLVLIWLLLLWGATSFDEVPPGNMGVKETFGERTGPPLESGFYIKYPWPIQKIRKFPVDKIQEIFIGPEMAGKIASDQRDDVLLWTESHYAKEKPFLIATDKKNIETKEDEPGEKSSDAKKAKESVSVALISALVTIQFKIKSEKLLNYGYKHKDPIQTLKFISEKEVAAYFASSDMMRVMSDGREDAISEIMEKIQNACDAPSTKLGIEIIAVTLLDAHPPIKVAKGPGGEMEGSGLPEAFQNVIGAKEKRETMILEAEKYKAQTIPEAEAREYEIISKAKAYKDYKKKVSVAEMDRFKKRIAGYRGMPELYMLNEKMKFLEIDCKNIRKYIVPASSKNDVYVINLEEKRRLDLIDLNDLKDDKSTINKE